MSLNLQMFFGPIVGYDSFRESMEMCDANYPEHVKHIYIIRGLATYSIFFDSQIKSLHVRCQRRTEKHNCEKEPRIILKIWCNYILHARRLKYFFKKKREVN